MLETRSRKRVFWAVQRQPLIVVGIQSNSFAPFLERQNLLTRLYQRQTPSSFAVGAEGQFLLLADGVRQFLDIFMDEAPAGVVPTTGSLTRYKPFPQVSEVFFPPFGMAGKARI